MKVPLFRIDWNQKDIETVTDVIKRGSHWADGPTVRDFEKGVTNYLGINTLAFSSGGTAMHAMMLAHGIKPGDEVVVPAFTFIATAYAPMYVGAKPVFSDIECDTFCLDPDDVNEKITDRTRMVIPIHYGGMPGKTISALQEICEDKNLILMEDAAESFGAKKDGKFVGTFGNSGIFSMCQNKVFTTGEGGLVVSPDEEVARKLKLIRSYGREATNYFNSGRSVDYVSLGYNWRMPEISGALGLSQLSKVEENIKNRQRVAKTYDARLSRIKKLKTPFTGNNTRNVYQMYTIKVLDGSRDKLKRHLESKNIASKVYFDPLYRYSVFKKEHTRLENTEEVSSQVLTLPLFPGMTDEEVSYVADSIEEFF